MFFGLLVVLVFWYFDIVPTHTKIYAMADIKVFGFHNCESESFSRTRQHRWLYEALAFETLLKYLY